MSVFEFHCIRCGNIFEELFKNSNDRFEIKCPKCNDDNIVQIVNSVNYPIAGRSIKPYSNKTQASLKPPVKTSLPTKS